MKDTTLVIMAAGIGSRFGGGIKQLEPVGPNGEIIMDYSIYDALQAGFNKVVFIIRKDLEKDFKEIIGNRIEKVTHVEYAFQELDNLPDGFEKPLERKKPWGTGHAVLSVKGLVKEPFMVINADDYYGKEGFKKIHDYMVNEMQDAACGDNVHENGVCDDGVYDDGVYDICMGGFILENTLSENGGVTRGVCKVDENGYLQTVTETYDIQLTDGKLTAADVNGNPVPVESGCHASMNMWGLPASFLNALEEEFPEFLSQLKEGDIKSEYLLPEIINRKVKEGKATVKVLETPDKWFGVTYKEDKQAVVDSLKALIAGGAYPEKLY